MYRGCFLEGITGHHLIITTRVYYENLYFDVLDKLCKIYDDHGDYQNIEHIAKQGIYVNAMEEISYYWFVYACMREKLLSQASTTYQEAIQRIYKDDETNASDAFRYLGIQLKSGNALLPSDMSKVKRILNKEASYHGMMYSLAAFVKIYKLVREQMLRTHKKATLLLATIHVSNQLHSNPQQQLSFIMKQIEKKILLTTRSSDAITRYSENQYLILLVSCKREDASIYKDRLIDHCKENHLLDFRHFKLKWEDTEIG